MSSRAPKAAGNKQRSSANTLALIVQHLESHADQERQRIIESVIAFFGLKPPEYRHELRDTHSLHQQLKPVDFKFNTGNSRPRLDQLLQSKSPNGDFNRFLVACFYLMQSEPLSDITFPKIAKALQQHKQSALKNQKSLFQRALKKGFVRTTVKGAFQITELATNYINTLPHVKAASSTQKEHARSASAIQAGKAKLNK